MKTLVLLAACITLAVFSSFAQQMPNGSFENWGSGEPNSWNTSNTNILGLDFTTVTKELSNPQNGSASAKLTVVTKSIPFVGTFTMQGALTLGTLNIDIFAQTATLSGGYPFNGMPQKLTGFFKYQPVNNDTCVLGWGLTKWNNGVMDTIGYAAIDTMGTFNNWTYFEIPLEYLIWEAPDTMNIIFVNSNPLDGIDHTGTKMWVDNLSFEYGTVAIEGVTFAKGISIYAEPFARQLIFSSTFEKTEHLDISLINMNGQVLQQWKKSMQVATEKLDVSDVSPGTYIIRIANSEKLIDSRKITILN
jgi:Putative carbohydrate metabolism domain/Secretion system C-terminal sorting domain